MSSHAQQSRAAPTAVDTAWVLIGALILWLLVRPYYGIVHDALLYGATALARLDPSAFARDFYLTRNASDAYSLFPRLYAAAVDVMGLDRATRALLLLGFGLWLGAAAALCRALLPGRDALLALLFVCFLPARYGCFDILSYGEPYMTPRLFAEAGSLAGLAALLHGRRLTALVLLLAAGLLHPLMALPALGVALLTLMQQDRRWLAVALAGIGLAVVLAMAGVAPFNRLGQQLDPDWLAVARFRTPYLFFTSWTYWNWANLAIDALLVGLAATSLGAAARRLLLAALATAALAYGLSYLAVDVAHNLLITQLQTWRVGWLLRALAFISLAGLLCDLFLRSGPSSRRLQLLFALVALTLALAHQANLMSVCTLAILLLSLPEYIALRRGRDLPGGRLLPLLTVSLSLGLTVVVLATAIGRSVSWQAQLSGSGLSTVLANEVLLHWLGMAAFAVLSIAVLRSQPRWRRAAVAVVLVMLPIAVGLWDRRSDWDRDLERNRIGIESLRSAVPADASVYWERWPMAVWFALGRTNYFSPTQGSGIIFDRDAAMIYERRRRLLLPLGTDDVRAPFTDSESRNRAGQQATAAAIRRVCQDGDAPDVLVLTKELPELKSTSWRPTRPAPTFVFRDGGYLFLPVDVFHVYECRALDAERVGHGNSDG